MHWLRVLLSIGLSIMSIMSIGLSIMSIVSIGLSIMSIMSIGLSIMNIGYGIYQPRLLTSPQILSHIHMQHITLFVHGTLCHMNKTLVGRN